MLQNSLAGDTEVGMVALIPDHTEARKKLELWPDFQNNMTISMFSCGLDCYKHINP